MSELVSRYHRSRRDIPVSLDVLLDQLSENLASGRVQRQLPVRSLSDDNLVELFQDLVVDVETRLCHVGNIEQYRNKIYPTGLVGG